MKVTITNKLILQDIPGGLKAELIDRLTFKNPRWIENDRMGYWNGDTSEYLSFYEENGNGTLILPRGFCRQLIFLCRRDGVTYELNDQRRTLPKVGFEFKGQLRPFQEQAIREVIKRDVGTLSSPTGSGKTVMALYLIAERGQPTLVIVHTKELMYQWKDRAIEFLGLTEDEIGLIGDGNKTLGGQLTIGIINSIYKIGDEIRDHVGHLIVDECHRIPSRTFTEAVTAFDSKYMLGLSATPWRRDGLSRLIFWHLGDVAHEIRKDDLVESGDVLPAEMIIRETNFQTSYDPSEEYSKMLSELTEDHARNALITSDVAVEAKTGGGICLVLSDRKAHCERLREMLALKGIPSELLTGDLSNGQRQVVVDRLNRGQVKVLVATGQLIGEGFDCRELSTLFLATPIKFNGRVLQYLGRVLRPAPRKHKARVYDYVDQNVGVLVAAAKARRRVYG